MIGGGSSDWQAKKDPRMQCWARWAGYVGAVLWGDLRYSKRFGVLFFPELPLSPMNPLAAQHSCLCACVVLQAKKGSVELRRYPASHPFAQLVGSDNIIAFTTKRYTKQPLIIRGPGAGAEVTAGGVFSDLLKLSAYLGSPS